MRSWSPTFDVLPPPPYNFAFTPVVHDLDAWWDMKKRGYDRPLTGFRPIHMPRNTGVGVVLAGLSTVLGFALIWYIWWLAALSFVGLIACAIGHTFCPPSPTASPCWRWTRAGRARPWAGWLSPGCSARPLSGSSSMSSSI